MPIARTKGLIDDVLKLAGALLLGLTVVSLSACGDGPDEVTPTPTAGPVSTATATPDPSALPGLPLNDPLEDERWGQFELQPEVTEGEIVEESPGPRADVVFSEFEDSWHHPDGITTTDPAQAEANPLIPVPSVVPPAEKFLLAQHIQDDGGPVEGGITYVIDEARPEILDAVAASLSIRWTLRAGRPLYLETSLEPLPIETPFDVDFTPVRESIRKVEVKGNPGVLLTYGGSTAGNMYNIAQPTVTISWFEGDVLWQFQSYFLTPADALTVANSIRSTTPQ